MNLIAIVDYGMGNLRSVRKAFEHVGADARIVDSPAGLTDADKLVLPGVGAFADAIGHLRDQGFVEPLKAFAASGKPFLGVCLGLQLLFDVSYEDGEHSGLGIVPGEVVRFDFKGKPGASELKIPHMGWNRLVFAPDCPLLAGIESGAWFYFVHSYYVAPHDQEVAWGRCDYGGEFTAMIWRDNLYATQFHPEKSQADGLKILSNFAAIRD